MVLSFRTAVRQRIEVIEGAPKAFVCLKSGPRNQSAVPANKLASNHNPGFVSIDAGGHIRSVMRHKVQGG